MVTEQIKKRAEFILGLVRGLTVKDLQQSFGFSSVKSVHVKVSRLKKYVYKRGCKWLLTVEGKKLITDSEIVQVDDVLYPVFQHNVWVKVDILGWDVSAVQEYVQLLFDKGGVRHTSCHLKGLWSYYFDLWGVRCRVAKRFLWVRPEPRVFDTVKEAIAYSNGVAWDVAEKAEKFFKVSLQRKNQVELSYSKQEYALLKTEVAKMYIEQRERMKILDEGGKVRILIDFSDRVPHFEGVHKVWSPADMEYFQEHFGDLCLNKPSLVSEIEKRLKKIERKVL